jgi:hypothetical protein
MPSVNSIEWFSNLACEADVAGCFNEAELARLNDFVASELLNCALPKISTAQEFEDAVKSLAKNKKDWSNSLSQLIIKLHELQSSNDREITTRELRQFEEQCPWSYLRKAARGSL